MTAIRAVTIARATPKTGTSASRAQSLHTSVPPSTSPAPSEANCLPSSSTTTTQTTSTEERDLLRRDRAGVRAQVVLVAHHGSHGSSDPDFVAATGALEVQEVEA